VSAQRELGLIRNYDSFIAEALEGARISEERLAAIRRRLAERHRSGSATIERDLRIHLRDRDAHIRNLEAQLRPYLLDHDESQEAML
jgi:hypothetical protein